MINIHLYSMHCDEETNEVGADEPYILAIAVALSSKVEGIPIQTPIASDVVMYAFQDVHAGGRDRFGIFDSFWGIGGTSAALVDPDDAIFLVAMMENDNGDPQIVRGVVDKAVTVSLIESLAVDRPGKVTTLIRDVDSARRLQTGVPNFDDAIGAPQELRFSSDELRRAELGETVTKTLVFSGDGGQYALQFQARNPEPLSITPPVRVAPIYAVMASGDLVWNRHLGHEDGTFWWASGNSKRVGSGWNVLQAFSAGDGIIYNVRDNGDLVWNRHEGREDGTFRWALPTGVTVGTGWQGAAHVFAGHEGVIYAVYNDGRVVWNRHLGRADGTFRWELDYGRNVANQVNKVPFAFASHVFAGGTPGIIYVINDFGELLWFRHDGWWDGSANWAFDEGKTVGYGWYVRAAFGLRNTSYVYAAMKDGELKWNIHTGWNDGTFRWAADTGKQVGTRWDVIHAFSG